MTGSPQQFPPPGAPLPEEPAGPPPGASYPAPYPPPPPRAPLAAPGMLGAAHKPGAIPLRPLSLGSMYDGAFRIIRFNPKATVGAAALVSAVAAVLPILVTTVLAFVADVSLEPANGTTDTYTAEQVVGVAGSYGSILLGSFLSWVGLVFVTGMVANVTRAAAIGKRLTLAEAWAATEGKRWRLLGLSVVVGLVVLGAFAVYGAAWLFVVVLSPGWVAVLLWALLSIPAFVALLWWLWIRIVYLPASALALEPIGVFASIGRGYQLTRGQFWRTFGIALLTVLITSVGGGILSFPFSIVGGIGGAFFPDQQLLIVVISTSIGSVLQNAFVAPFTAAVTTLQYIDQRMRKEAYDVELMREAGLIPR